MKRVWEGGKLQCEGRPDWLSKRVKRHRTGDAGMARGHHRGQGRQGSCGDGPRSRKDGHRRWAQVLSYLFAIHTTRNCLPRFHGVITRPAFALHQTPLSDPPYTVPSNHTASIITTCCRFRRPRALAGVPISESFLGPLHAH